MTSSTRPIVIWGAGGHARVVADIICQRGEFDIAGYIDDVFNTPRPSGILNGRVLGGREQLEGLLSMGIHHAIVAIGLCESRLTCSKILTDSGFALVTLVHPRAVIASDVTLGNGTVISAGAIVNSGSTIGDNVILNTGCTIDHDCTVESGTHICPGVHVGGGSFIGSSTWIGIGSTIIDKIRIGAGSCIGAGSLVLRDIPDGVLAYGHPAKVIGHLA